MTILDDEIQRLNQLPDDKRAQAKYEHLCKVMEGEGANYSASIWCTLISDFALACMNIGFNPRVVIRQLHDDAEKFLDRKLKEQSMTLDAPKGARPN